MSDGPNLGAIDANRQHMQAHHNIPSQVATAQELGLNNTQLGQSPIHAHGEMPSLGVQLQLPGGVEGNGALGTHDLGLGNAEPFGVKTEALIGEVNLVGDTSMSGVTPVKGLNAEQDHGLAASSALDSSVAVGHSAGH